MKRLPTLPAARRQLLWFAVIVAVSLLSIYVQVLHDSVARGERMRDEQRATARDKAFKSAAMPLRRNAR